MFEPQDMEALSGWQHRIGYYSLAQFAGWLMHFVMLVLLLLLSRAGEGISFTDLLLTGSLCLTGFLLTHTFRSIAGALGWKTLPLPRLILMILSANLLMALMATIVLSQISRLMIPDISFADQALLFFHNYSLYLFWSGIYFGINFFRRYRREEITRLKWESSLKEFELNKLKSQLNPHFVFNALNGIRSLIEENPEKSRQAINQLSNILRNSLLSDRAQTIPLSEEIHTVMDYLHLEKIRFDARLDFEVQTDESCLAVQVPPMMIQTLVENAVKHGISPAPGGGKISLSAQIQDKNLSIIIRNSGKYAPANPAGYGIPNTRQRLRLIYGEEAGFAIYQENPELVRVSLNIPLKKK